MKPHFPLSPGRYKGRGAVSNPQNRFDAWRRERDPAPFSEEVPPIAVEDSVGDVADDDSQSVRKIGTTLWMRQAKSIISRNSSPDIPFDASINPYQGCEHGCIYCYARPSHTWLGHSAGLDFETLLYGKQNAAALLEKTLSAPGYQPKVIVLGGNTDPYQPVEREQRITRSILEVLDRFSHPVSVTTKSGLVMRDSDLLARMARRNLARVFVSVTSLRNEITRTLEPRASSAARRLTAIRRLSEQGIPVGVLVAPVIPALTDHELEAIVNAAADAGATSAACILLRLPGEVADLFSEWLREHHPLKANHVLNLLRQMHGGELYDANFASRMSGTGVFADLLQKRFQLVCRRRGLNHERLGLRTDLFTVAPTHGQMKLF